MAKEEKIIIDASDCVMGRIATYAAKQALLGKTIEIVNCDDCLISGKKHAVLNTYRAKLAKGGTAQKGPFIARSAEGIFKRAVRGMLPWSKTRGREAFKRVKCHAKVPQEFESAEKITFKANLIKPHVRMSQLLKLI